MSLNKDLSLIIDHYFSRGILIKKSSITHVGMVVNNQGKLCEKYTVEYYNSTNSKIIEPIEISDN